MTPGIYRESTPYIPGSCVGDVFDSVGGGIGRVEHGNYAVIDLAGSYVVAERHRIGLRLENVLDEEHDTSITRLRRDLDGVPTRPETWAC